VRVSISQTTPTEVARGIRILGECAGELLATDSPAQRPLIL
jgi:hypothetical protein